MDISAISLCCISSRVHVLLYYTQSNKFGLTWSGAGGRRKWVRNDDDSKTSKRCRTTSRRRLLLLFSTCISSQMPPRLTVSRLNAPFSYLYDGRRDERCGDLFVTTSATAISHLFCSLCWLHQSEWEDKVKLSLVNY